MSRPKNKYKENAPSASGIAEEATSSEQDNYTTKSSGRQVQRTRNYAFIVYPESAPEHWRDVLNDAHVEALISPLHDRDTNPNGEQKKPHYHVLVLFSSVKTIEQAQELRDSVGGVGWENVASVRGYARYLCHLDNPEKAQYSIENVVELGGADYAETIRRMADATAVLREMTAYIEDNNVLWYDRFFAYCAKDKPEWFDALTTRCTYVIYTYIKSRAKRLEAENRAIARGYIDPETGEIKE